MLPKYFPVACHTGFIGTGSIFVAIQGQNQNGIYYIPKAIENGATTIIMQEKTELPKDINALIKQKNITLMRVPNTRKALSKFSAKHAGYPAKKLKIIGITGTKGKTSTAWILDHILKSAGYKTALLGTIANKIGNIILPHDLTTPQPDYLHQFFKTCVKQRVEYVVMEVAAQALSLHRVDDITFDGIIFTNFGKEHGEFYPTMDQYFGAKCHIFKHAKPEVPIFINIDNKSLRSLSEKNSEFKTFGINSTADYQGYIEEHINQLFFSVQNQQIQVPTLCGKYNIYNCLAALALAHQLKIGFNSIKQALQTMPSIAGRMETYYLQNGVQCIIDYAHTPDSYEAVLSLLRKKTEHLIVVFGCGGSRDKEKRPILGFIAATYADLVLLTSDNPRFEDPQKIILDILGGIEKKDCAKVLIEIDRKKAIQKACIHAQTKSIIVLLGKGRDEYQLIKGKKYHFSEREIIQRL